MTHIDPIKEAATRFCSTYPCSLCKFYKKDSTDEWKRDCLIFQLSQADEPERVIGDLLAWAKRNDEAETPKVSNKNDEVSREEVLELLKALDNAIDIINSF